MSRVRTGLGIVKLFCDAAMLLRRVRQPYVLGVVRFAVAVCCEQRRVGTGATVSKRRLQLHGYGTEDSRQTDRLTERDRVERDTVSVHAESR